MDVLEQGTGTVRQVGNMTYLVRHAATLAQYSNAQIDDYHVQLNHHPPMRMTLRARFSHNADQLKGTAGFGLWNAPFAPGSRRLRLPKTAWFFFGSPPLHIALARNIAGHGFKVATLDATRWQFLALAPTAPLGFLLMRVPWLYRHLWPIGQAAIGVSESTPRLDLTKWHAYRLDWLPNQVIFAVDDQVIHVSPYSPKGKMGFVAWIDNQYVVVTPQGNFGWGLVDADGAQQLELENIQLTKL